MSRHEHDPDDLAVLPFLAQGITNFARTLENPEPNATLADILEELDLLASLFAGGYGHVQRMRTQLISPYATWEDQHTNWQRNQEVES